LWSPPEAEEILLFFDRINRIDRILGGKEKRGRPPEAECKM
jgi:hypothetical protein